MFKATKNCNWAFKNTTKQNETQEVAAQKTTETLQTAEPIVNQSVEKKIDETSNITSENIKQENKSTTSTTKEKFSNLFGKLKNIKLKNNFKNIMLSNKKYENSN